MSGPDSGLAMAIGLAMICMLAVPALVGGGIGYALASRAGRDGQKASGVLRLAVTLSGAFLGALLGAGGVMLTFFESELDPVLVLETSAAPPDAVFILEDPAGDELEWNLFRTEARVALPSSGVVRVRDLGDLRGLAFSARTTSGASSVGYSGGPAPAGLPGPSVVCVSFAPWDPDRVDECEARDAALVALIEAREAR